MSRSTPLPSQLVTPHDKNERTHAGVADSRALAVERGCALPRAGALHDSLAVGMVGDLRKLVTQISSRSRALVELE